jgi:hypothetical protein
MHPHVKHDILAIIEQAIHRIENKDNKALSELSNHTIHNASIFQDEDSVSIAVIIYALSKLMDRSSVDKTVILKLRQAHSLLAKNKLGRYNAAIHGVTKAISRLDHKLKLYIEEVISQAQIRKGSKLYDHGISLARAAEMLGISQWELMGYVGNMQIVDRTEEARKVLERIRFTRGLFAK